MGQFVAALHAAHLNRLDKDAVSKQLLAAWAAMARGADGAGVFLGSPQHYWTEDAKLFYVALRLDGWRHEDTCELVDLATRAR